MPASTVPQPRFDTARLRTGPLVHYAEQGDPDGESVLFIHGWPDSWFSFSRVQSLLPAAYHTLALDQRGFGDSERPPSGYTIDQLAADLVAFLDAVDAQRATLIGHSMGSFVARRVAETNPERVAGLVLIGSAVTPANDILLEVRDAVKPLTDPLPLDFVREFQASALQRPVPDDFFNTVVAESMKAPVRVWQKVWDGLLAFNDAEQLQHIAAPTLILWGDHDALFPGEDGQAALTESIPGSQLIVYEDTGHSPNWEQPERVAGDLESFMNGT